MAQNYLQKLKNVSAFVFDIDGVVTDGFVYVDDEGVFSRSSNIKDGYALNKAASKDYLIIFISGGNATGIQKRLNGLGIDEVHLNVKDKRSFLTEVLKKYNKDLSSCVMMGDDEPDLDLLQHVGCSTCPADAVPAVRTQVDYVSTFAGGKGCIRDLIEAKMKLDGTWE